MSFFEKFAIAVLVFVAGMATGVKWHVGVDAQRELEAHEAQARETLRRLDSQALVDRNKNETLARLGARVDSLLGELRGRPARPVGGSDPAAAASCTGAGLYLQDSDFLVREAARAERVRIERDACHDKYDALTKAIEPQRASP